MRQVICEGIYAGFVKNGPHIGQRHSSNTTSLALTVSRNRWERILKRKPRLAHYAFQRGVWVLSCVERAQ